MKRAGKICLCLAGGLVLHTGLRAGDEVSSANPYAAIAARNVFDIHPPPPVDQTQLSAEPPPKITPNGITSVNGHVRALFKVSIPPKPGVPPSEQTYMLSEGQQQDDIEVVRIDEKAQIITFNNHGTVQELPLAVAAASGPSGQAPAVPGPVPTFPGRFAPGGSGGVGMPFTRFGQSGNNANNAGSRRGVALGGGGMGGYTGAQNNQPASSQQPDLNGMSADDRMAVIAARTAQLQGQGNPIWKIMPPTPFDGQAGVNRGNTTPVPQP